MGGLINVIVCILAAAAFYGTGHPVLFSLSAAVGVIAFWSWGVMHNYATWAAKRRRDVILENMRLAGRSEDDIADFDSHLVTPAAPDLDAVPNWLAVVNMLATFVGVILLIWGAIVRFL